MKMQHFRLATLIAANLVFALLLVPVLRLQGKDVPPGELLTAEQVRQLTPEQTASHHPVRLRGVVTFFDPSQFFQFVQDDTAGIYFSLDNLSDSPPLAAGQLVELEGEANPGEYAPIVVPRRIQILGMEPFPPPSRSLLSNWPADRKTANSRKSTALFAPCVLMKKASIF